MMKCFIITAALLTLNQTTVAQKNIVLRQLDVGDTMPAILPVGKIVNQRQKIVNGNFGDFRGKDMLIVFWATWCVPCVKDLPKLDSLQKLFKNDLNILLVSVKSSANVVAHAESGDQIRRYLASRNIELSAIVEDTLLNRLFPHITIPHEIWVDKEGVVKAITSNEEVSKASMAKFIAGYSDGLKRKKDYLEFDWNRPLGGLAIDPDEINYRSILLKRKPGLSGGMHAFRDSNNNIIRGYDHNVPLGHLFIKAYSLGMFAAPNSKRMFFDLTDSSRYMTKPSRFPYLKWEDKEAWMADVIVSYELTLPHGVSDTIFYEYMFQDLNRFFPVKGRIEYREVPCLILVKKNGAVLLPSKESQSRSSMRESSIEFQNKPLSFLVWRLSMFKDVEPIVDETRFVGNMDMKIDFSESKLVGTNKGLVINNSLDVDVLKKQLATYGLDIVRGIRSVPVLLLSDKPEVYTNWPK